MLKARFLTALVLIILLGLLLVMGSIQVWLVALTGLSVLAAWEWARLSGVRKPAAQWLYALALGGFIWFGLQVSIQDHLLLWLVLLWGGLVPFILYHFARTGGAWRLSVPPLLMLGVVVIFLFAWGLFHGLLRFGPAVVVWWMALVWLMDIGAYFAGRRFGRHKLAPAISPGKTWEGVAGGAAATIVGILVGAWLWPDLWNGTQLAAFALIAMLSVVGDLFESVMKRWQGMKDSSQLLPGHGGVLDRIDSLLLALPWMWWVATSLGPTQ